MFGTKTKIDNADYLRKELYERALLDPALFDWLSEAVSDGIWYWDLENIEHEWMSPELKALFGYADHEVPNTSAWWQEQIFPQDKDLAFKAYLAHVGPERKPYDLTVRYRHKNGSTVWVRCRGTASFNEEGKPIRMLGSHLDMTQLMRTQEALVHKNDVLDLLCTTALDGYWEMDFEAETVVLSARWKVSLGYQANELQATIQAWEALVHPDDLPKAKEAIRQHRDFQKPINIVLRFRRKDGSYAYHKAQGAVMNNCLYGSYTDVSDLEQARADARDANTAKTVFLATMSHEIRTPLNAVLGMTHVLFSTSLTDEQHDCLLTIKNSGTHLLALLNDLLDFSQIEAGRLELLQEDFDIQATVRDVVEIMQQDFKSKGIELQFETQVPAGSSFVGDSDRTRQVLFNLLSNSCKFTTEGSVTARIEPDRQQECDGVCIHVTDTGTGMTPEQQSIIFREFTQACAETRRRHGGSGLGLAISQKLVAAMKGTFRVKSKVGQGSTFSVWLPGLKQPTRETSPRPSLYLYDPTPSSRLTESVMAAGWSAVEHKDIQALNKANASNPTITVLIGRNTPTNCLDELRLSPTTTVVTVGRNSKVTGSLHFILPPFSTSDEIADCLSGKSQSYDRQHRRISGETCSTERSDSRQRLRILVAEDNNVNQRVLCRLLSKFPCDVLLAGNGQEAVHLAERHKLDLILMDCMMPLLDGIEATRVIRKFDKATRIVALTANASTKDRDTCLEAGMDLFMTKPIRIAELTELINDCLRMLSGPTSRRGSRTIADSALAA